MSSKNLVIEEIYKGSMSKEDSIVKLLKENNIDTKEISLIRENYSVSRSDYNEINNGKTVNYNNNKSNSKVKKSPKKEILSIDKLHFRAPHLTYKMEEKRLEEKEKNFSLSITKRLKKNRRLLLRKKKKSHVVKYNLDGIPMNKTFDTRKKKFPGRLKRSATAKKYVKKRASRERYRTTDGKVIMQHLNPFPIPKSGASFKKPPPYFFTKMSRKNMGFDSVSSDYKKKRKRKSFNLKKIYIPVREAFDNTKKFDNRYLMYHDNNGVPIDYERTAFSLERKKKFQENHQKRFLKIADAKKSIPYVQTNPAVVFLQNEVRKKVKLPYELKSLKEKLKRIRKAKMKKGSPLKRLPNTKKGKRR